MISQAFDSQDQQIVAQCLVRVNKTVPAKRGRPPFGSSATAGGPHTNKEATRPFWQVQHPPVATASKRKRKRKTSMKFMVQFLYNRLS